MGQTTGIEWTGTRACGKCFRDLSLDEFPIDRSRPLGRGYVCKECRNASSRSGYVKKGLPGKRGWIVPIRDGDKKQARRRVNYLVEQGIIPHPEDLPCFDCGDMVFVEPHRHEYDHALGYDGENQLYVEPVCSKCHHNREEVRRGKAA